MNAAANALVILTLAACRPTDAQRVPVQTNEPGVLSVATYLEFAPVAFRDPKTGGVAGMDLDLLTDFAAEHDLALRVVEVSFAGIWERPGTGEVDLAACGISRLQSRDTAGVVWTEPCFTVDRSLLIRKIDQTNYRTIEDLARRSIGYTAGSTGELDTRARAPSTTQLVAYANEELALLDLRTGKLDALARGDVSNRHDARQHPEFAVIDVHPMSPREQFCFAVAQRHRSLVTALNEYLLEAQRSGRLNRMFAKYLN